MDQDRPRFFFCHIQKTGGTSLLVRLRQELGANRVYPSNADGHAIARVTSVSHLLSCWHRRGPKLSVVSGHFPLCTLELLAPGFKAFTLLREPVERTLSYLRHHRRLTSTDRDKSLETIYSDSWRFASFINNHMVKMLGTTCEEVGDGMLTHLTLGREHLERAKERLAVIDLVGITERFDQFWAELGPRFGLELGAPIIVNRTEHVEVSHAFRDRIAAENSLDVELFDYALELVSRTSSRRQLERELA